MNESLANVYAVGAALADAIGRELTRQAQPVTDIATALRSDLGQTIAGYVPSALDVGAFIASAIIRFGEQFTGALTDPEDFWRAAVTAFNGNLDFGAISADSVMSKLINAFFAAVKAMAVAAVENTTTETTYGLANIVATAASLDSTPEQIRDASLAFSKLAADGNPSAKALNALLGAVLFLKSGMEALTAARTRQLEIASNETYQPERLTADQAAEALIKGVATDDQITASYQASGLSKNYFDALVKLHQWYPDPLLVFEQGRFGHLDAATADGLLKQLGVSDDKRTLLPNYTKIIPSFQDVTHWFTRDAFYDDIVAKFGLDQDMPPHAMDIYQSIGVDEDIVKYIWRSHWELPSLQLAFEMYQRIGQDGTPILEYDDLLRLMRAQGVEPFWREKILQVSFNPLTRVDIRRMHKVGVITDRTDLVNQYRNVGYSPDNAMKLADFTEKLNDTEHANEKKAALTEAQHEVSAAIELGTVSHAEGVATLIAAGLSAVTAEAVARKADLAIVKRISNAVLAGVKREYLHSLLTDTEATSALTDAGWTYDSATAVVRSWRYDKDYAEKSPQRQTRHALTEAQILTLYDNHVLAQADADAALTRLGVPAQDRGLLFSLATAKRARQSTQHRAAAVLTEYKALAIDRADAEARLAALGLDTDVMSADLDAADAQREAHHPEIPLPTLEKLALAKLVPENDLVDELRRRGYRDKQILWLTSLWGYDLADKLGKAAAKEAAGSTRSAKQQAADVERRKKLVLRNVRAAYKKGVIGYNEALSRLQSAGYTAEEAALNLGDIIVASPDTGGTGGTGSGTGGITVTVTPVASPPDIHGLPFGE